MYRQRVVMLTSFFYTLFTLVMPDILNILILYFHIMRVGTDSIDDAVPLAEEGPQTRATNEYTVIIGHNYITLKRYLFATAHTLLDIHYNVQTATYQLLHLN